MRKLPVRQRVFRLFLFFAILASVILCYVPPGETRSKPAPLYQKKLNKIKDSGKALNPFFEKLALLRKGKLHRVTVLHIGDSHIQPDSMTSRIREPLHDLFGDGGRGLCFPYRLAGTNGPGDYRITSNVSWEGRRSVRTDIPLPVGLSGYTIRSDKENAVLDVTLLSGACASSPGYGFDTVVVLHEKGPHAYDLSVSDEAGGEVAKKETLLDGDQDMASKFAFAGAGCHASIVSAKTGDEQNYTQIYAISLERRGRGVVYHSVGVNGASFEHFSRSEYFARHVGFLKPDLVIVSLGTNSAYGGSFHETEVFGHIETLYKEIRSASPNGTLLFVTPPDSAAPRKKQIKANVLKVRNLITEFCSRRRIAYWDFYGIMGSYGSISKWRKNKLVQPDMVHFTRAGYELQGTLLFEAILQGYRAYEPDRF